VLVALLVCLDSRPPSAACFSAIGISRHRPADPAATSWPPSGRAVEAAGDVDVLLLDKTGTITLGNRHGVRRSVPRPASTEQELADAAQLASLADETPEGRSIVVLAKEQFDLRGRDVARCRTPPSSRSRRRRA